MEGQPKAGIDLVAAHAERAFGPVTNGLQLALELEASGNSVLMGQPIKARFHFRNAGPFAINLKNPTLWQPNSDEFVVTDSDGKKIQTFSAWFSFWDVGRVDELRPGKSVAIDTNSIAFYPEPFDGSKVHHPVGNFAFLKPGKYTLQYKLRAPVANPPAWQGELASAPVQIEVVAAPPASASAPATGNSATPSLASSKPQSLERSEQLAQQLVEAFHNPLELVRADIYKDGGTIVIAFKDAQTRTLEFCLDRREDSVTPNRLFIGAAYPNKLGAILVTSGGSVEKMVLSLLKEWQVQHAAGGVTDKIPDAAEIAKREKADPQRKWVQQVSEILEKRNRTSSTTQAASKPAKEQAN